MNTCHFSTCAITDKSIVLYHDGGSYWVGGSVVVNAPFPIGCQFENNSVDVLELVTLWRHSEQDISSMKSDSRNITYKDGKITDM